MSEILNLFTKVIEMFKAFDLPLLGMNLYELLFILTIVWFIIRVISSKFFKNIITSAYQDTEFYKDKQFEEDVKNAIYRSNVAQEAKERTQDVRFERDVQNVLHRRDVEVEANSRSADIKFDRDVNNVIYRRKVKAAANEKEKDARFNREVKEVLFRKDVLREAEDIDKMRNSRRIKIDYLDD